MGQRKDHREIGDIMRGDLGFDLGGWPEEGVKLLEARELLQRQAR